MCSIIVVCMAGIFCEFFNKTIETSTFSSSAVSDIHSFLSENVHLCEDTCEERLKHTIIDSMDEDELKLQSVEKRLLAGLREVYV